MPFSKQEVFECEVPGCDKRAQIKERICRQCIFAWRRLNGPVAPKRKFLVTIDSNGYARLCRHHRLYKKTNTFEHTALMEEHLGRKMYPNENIHHINGVRHDNRIENLQLWIKPQPRGIKIEDAIEWAQVILARYGSQ